MKSKDAWNKLVKHCRWIGIPMRHVTKRDNRIDLNGHIAQLLATTNKYMDWEKTFDGAFCIRLYFSPSRITWQHVSVLAHEMGHVLDYRENIFLSHRSILQDELAANRHAIKVAKLLEIPKEKIQPFLDDIISQYKAVLRKNNDQQLQPL